MEVARVDKKKSLISMGFISLYWTFKPQLYIRVQTSGWYPKTHRFLGVKTVEETQQKTCTKLESISVCHAINN